MTYVRRAIVGDMDRLLVLCAAFHAESPHHSKLEFSHARVEQLILAALSNDDWLALVACDAEGVIVGMSLFYCMESFFSTELEVGDLTFWVAKDHRGGRAAMMMLKQILAWASAKGASRIQMGVTTGINHDQVARFLGKYRFENVGFLMVRQPVE